MVNKLFKDKRIVTKDVVDERCTYGQMGLPWGRRWKKKQAHRSDQRPPASLFARPFNTSSWSPFPHKTSCGSEFTPSPSDCLTFANRRSPLLRFQAGTYSKLPSKPDFSATSFAFSLPTVPPVPSAKAWLDFFQPLRLGSQVVQKVLSPPRSPHNRGPETSSSLPILRVSVRCKMRRRHAKCACPPHKARTGTSATATSRHRKTGLRRQSVHDRCELTSRK